MVSFELTLPESRLLLKILDSYLSQLAAELTASGSEELGDLQREEETLVHKLLARLNEPGNAVPPKQVFGEYWE